MSVEIFRGASVAVFAGIRGYRYLRLPFLPEIDGAPQSAQRDTEDSEEEIVGLYGSGARAAAWYSRLAA
jgi:hypothetical protein